MMDKALPAHCWRDPSDNPAIGSTVAVLQRHWKADFPQSYSITFGVVRKDPSYEYVVQNLDFMGTGLDTLGPETFITGPLDTFVAWMPLSIFATFAMPDPYGWFGEEYPDYKERFTSHD